MKEINKLEDGVVYELNSDTLVKIGKNVEIRQTTRFSKQEDSVLLSEEELQKIIKNL